MPFILLILIAGKKQSTPTAYNLDEKCRIGEITPHPKSNIVLQSPIVFSNSFS
jgi:hypothetical protein